MDIETLVKKHAGTMWLHETPIRAALTELAAAHALELEGARLLVKELQHTVVQLTAAVDTDYEQLYREQLARVNKLEAERVPSPSCRECANRGRVNGLSQETYCDSCVWQGQSFRVNQYAAAPQPKKEGE